LVSTVQPCESSANDGGYVVGASDVQVGEVGRVGFVEVVVAVVRGVVGLRNDGSEEVFGLDVVLLEVYLVDDAAEDSNLAKRTV
jgi:hypothetical protein